MVTITLYVRQQKRHRCIKQSFGLCGRGRGWDDLGEWHGNLHIIVCDTNCQSRFDAWDRVLGAGALGWPRGMWWGGRGRGVQDGEYMYTVADSCQCMAKPLQCFKVVSLQLKWMNLFEKGYFSFTFSLQLLVNWIQIPLNTIPKAAMFRLFTPLQYNCKEILQMQGNPTSLS